MDNLLPVFKTKLKFSEIKSLYDVLSFVIINNANERFVKLTKSENYTMRSLLLGIRKRLAGIDVYNREISAKRVIFKMDYNQYDALISLYKQYKPMLDNLNEYYYDNIFTYIFMEFDKQKISLQ